MIQNTGNLGFRLQSGANYNIIRNCEVSTTGIAFYINDNSSYNLLTNNYIHDLKMIVDDTGPNCTLPSTDPLWSRNPCDNDFGAVSFWLRGPYNEISYNRSVNNVGHSFDYGVDGGFLEFYANCTGSYVHHNFVDKGVGLVEASNGVGINADITISYNVFIENKAIFAVKPSFPTSNFKVEHNTFITAEGTSFNNMFGENNGLFIRNNIFVLSGSGERVGISNVFTHTNNLYHLLNGAMLGAVILGEGELLADPLFLDAANKDYRLQPTSPAINAGANLGYTADFLNMPVPFGPAPDMGAYESAALVPEINIKQATTDLPDNTGMYSFGLVGYTAPKTVVFTIENLGGATLNLTGSPRVNVGGTGFSLAVDAPATIAAGGSATFEVTLTTSAFTGYAGTKSINNNDANENPYNFLVSGDGYDATKALQSITFNPLPTQMAGAPELDPGAIASSGLPVTYTSSNTAVATIMNNKVQLLAEGISVITASQMGDAAFNPAINVTQNLTVLGSNFTEGNIVVTRVGNGTTSLGATSAPLSLLEFLPAMANQPVSVKTVTVGSTTNGSRLTIVGNTVFEGQLSRSTDGRYLTLAGYDQPTGVTSSTSTAGNKVVGRVDFSGLVDYSSNFPTTASGSAKIAVSDNGNRFWTGINNIGYVTFGQTTTPTAVNNAAQRSLGIFNNQLFHQQGFTSLNYTTTALPTGASALVNTASVPNSQSYGGFAFLDLDAAVSWNNTGFDVLYVANVNAGLEKFYFNGISWVAVNSNANSPANSYFPTTAVSTLTATVNNLGQPVIYATSGNGSATNNRLYAITDASGRTGAMIGSGGAANVTTVTLATAGINYAFRGVAFAPREFALPISLAAFTGSLIDQRAALQWVTLAEINASRFVIERSFNGREFTKIGEVAATNRNRPTTYTFDDGYLKRGINYYRLTMVDLDGSFRYSNIVVIKLSSQSSPGLTIFPNPVINQITLSHTKANQGAVMQIIAANGKLVAQFQVIKNAEQTSVDASPLLPGQYFINYINQGVTVTKGFIK